MASEQNSHHVERFTGLRVVGEISPKKKHKMKHKLDSSLAEADISVDNIKIEPSVEDDAGKGISVSEQVPNLIEQILKSIPKEQANMRFEKAVGGLDWEKYAPPGFTPELCKEKVTKVCSKVRKWRSLREVLEDSHNYSQNPTHMLFLDPKVPKKPMTSYFKYYLERLPKFKKKHPEASSTEISKIAAAKFKEMLPEKKEKYMSQYRSEKEEYDKELAQFVLDNPEYTKLKNRRTSSGKLVKSGAPTYTSPMQFYINEKTEEALAKDASGKGSSNWNNQTKPLP